MFRIDHYLGKETVQNILALRFANQLFEPIWNANYVDHVQITMAEDIGLGGRAGYYDGIGAARDVIQNHLLQLLAFTAMEEPISFSPEASCAPRRSRSSPPPRPVGPLAETTARGQYTGGWQGGEKVPGLMEEEGFAQDSTTETFAAIDLRGRDPPLGRGAVLPAHRQAARPPRHRDRGGLQAGPAPAVRRDDDRGARAERARRSGCSRTRASRCGSGRRCRAPDGGPRRHMDFGYGNSFTESSPEAYERLILDVLLGEPSLFPVNDEVERSWEILDPVLEHWAAPAGKPGRPTRPARWGPDSADAMLARTGRTLEASVIIDLPADHDVAGQQQARELREQGGAHAHRPGADAGHRHRRRQRTEERHRRGQPRQPRAPVPGDRAGARREEGRAAAGRADPGRRRRRRERGHRAALLRPAGRTRARRACVPLLLPDAPVVAWWPFEAPAVPVGGPDRQARHSGGSPTRRREEPDQGVRAAREVVPRPGDTDLAWTRLTLWRALLASALDLPPYEQVTGGHRRPARPSRRRPTCWPAWLAARLRLPVKRLEGRATARASCRCGWSAGPAPSSSTARTARSARCASRASRTGGSRCSAGAVRDCLAEELRRLDPDEIYGRRSRRCARSTAAGRAGPATKPAGEGAADDRPQREPTRPRRSPAVGHQGDVEPQGQAAGHDRSAGRRARQPGAGRGRRGAAGHPPGRRAGRRGAASVVLTGGRTGIAVLEQLRAVAGPRRRRLVAGSTSTGATSGSCPPATRSATRRRPARRCSTTCRSTRHGCTRWAPSTAVRRRPGGGGRGVRGPARGHRAAGGPRAVPGFDVCLLGMGEEGHTASVFPHSPAVLRDGALGRRRARLPEAAADPGLADAARDPPRAARCG